MMTHRVLRPYATGPFLFLCDHASNEIPVELSGLGLPPAELVRHIAWDIGAAGVTEGLSGIFDSPTVLCGTSRLVIDCNRQLHAADLIPESSDGTAIPGNLNLSTAARNARIEQWFQPYHQAVEEALLQREASRAKTVVVSVHSMTPSLAGQKRPWQISLSRLSGPGPAEAVLAALRAQGDIVVGDNQPYNLDPDVDYSVPFHAIRRGLEYIQVEFRQDEINDVTAQQRWAERFARALSAVSGL